MIRTCLSHITSAIGLLVAMPSALAVTIQVSQESSPNAGDFQDNVLGTIEAYGTTSSVDAYYNFDAGNNSSWNGPAPTMTQERSHIFLVNASDGLSLVFVHDAVSTHQNGNDGSATTRFVISGDTAGWLVKDDPNGDGYPNTGGVTLIANQSWEIGRTDGAALGTLVGNWSLTAQFTAINAHGSAGFIAYSGDGTTITLSTGVPELNRRVRFQPWTPPPALVNIASANPPLDNPFLVGQQPFADVLQTGAGSALTQGIGATGTPAQASVTYAPVTVTFSAAPAPTPNVSNVTVTCTPSGPYLCPSVTSVAGTGAGPYTLTLSGAIPPLSCTTITFAGTKTGQKLQYQSLPGDVNLNGSVSATDVQALVAALSGGAAAIPANLPRYDINRSGAISAADVLREVQLLNGLNSPQAFLGATVAPCP